MFICRVDPDNIKGRGTWTKDRVDKDCEDPTNLVQSVYMGFLSGQGHSACTACPC